MTTPSRREDTPAQPGDPGTTAPATPAPTPTAPTSEFTLPAPLPGDADLEGSFGRYTIVRRLGKGGMGRVYLAHDTQLDRLVALKVPQLEGGDRATTRERFYREARAAANLHHPNICPVFDVGAEGDVPYLTMAYVEGRSLHEWALQPRPAAEVAALVAKVALALDEAHHKGVVHRDLKPSNILLDRRGEPVVMDFGLARRLHLPDEARLTSPGLLMGTPGYIPPEHIRGEMEPSPLGDVYSLGVVLYELLVGRCPFTGDVMAVLAQVVADAPALPSSLRQGIDPRLDAVFLRALAKKPAERFPGMAAFAQALHDACAPAAPSDQPANPATDGPDPALAPKVLELLRTWGWARALQKMRDRVLRADTPAKRAAYQGYLDWMAAERGQGAWARAAEAVQRLPQGKALRGWELVGRASFLLRERDYGGAQGLLVLAEGQGDPDDRMLQATIAHTRASALVHLGQCDKALPFLHRALDLFGRRHFMVGRVLDTLGMAYAYKGNFPVAREFYEHSIRYKEEFDDEGGIAVSHGQLGRLYLEWGYLDEAERHFQEDLRLSQKLRSRFSEAQIYNHLGQVALARGEREAASGRRGGARRHFAAAAGWLDQSIRLCEESGYAVSEGFARKDRALVYYHEGDLDRAQEQVQRALELFAADSFSEGVAKAQLVVGVILRRRERFTDAERRFRMALAHFEETQEVDKVVRALWEIARTMRDAGTPTPLVTRAYLEALAKAECCRHDPLVRGIEEELHEVDVEAYLRHIYRRVRGAGIDEDSASLVEGRDDVGTVLAIDLPGFAEFSHGLDAEGVLLTFNHLLADFADVLARHQARVLAYRGSGLLALTLDHRHAERGVRAALDLVEALEEFNRPRQLLGLPIFQARIGISSGDVLLGNVGTYHKMDFTAIGTALNVASALRNEAEPGLPCVARATCDLVRERYAYRSAAPRRVAVAGFGEVEVWDVVPPGRAT
jgi:class 3 adenylate cyclase/predicted Ser/Thr protein kinase/Tfp pilus assembly protein PilF